MITSCINDYNEGATTTKAIKVIELKACSHSSPASLGTFEIWSRIYMHSEGISHAESIWELQKQGRWRQGNNITRYGVSFIRAFLWFWKFHRVNTQLYCNNYRRTALFGRSQMSFVESAGIILPGWGEMSEHCDHRWRHCCLLLVFHP